eukprot:CAMPEP_0179130438 /NCGR_PEP_ID=MMETSP0796-20121207/61925_1 /TAXON_ID=73915 /ORGANISM="Pyrodinium bahamense, Strain pbaha01" /LENGTH=34 /DNA_ID= /DNA_START= /DNA_END= /DNA_ORIENTATION=
MTRVLPLKAEAIAVALVRAPGALNPQWLVVRNVG